MNKTFNDRAASICNRRGLSYDASQEVMAEANKADELVAALEQIGNAVLSLDVAREIARAALAKVSN